MKAVVSPAAREDILRQFQYYLDNGSIVNAENFLRNVRTSIAKLTRHPRIGSPKRMRSPLLKHLRRWPVKDFESIGIYYLLTHSSVQVLRILHSKRDISLIFS